MEVTFSPVSVCLSVGLSVRFTTREVINEFNGFLEGWGVAQSDPCKRFDFEINPYGDQDPENFKRYSRLY